MRVGASVNKGRYKNIFTLYYKLDLETLDATNTTDLAFLLK